MRKHFWTLFASAFIGIFMLASCNSGTDNTPAETLTLSEESITLTVLEEYSLLADYDGNESIVWSSSDASIVTVDNSGNLLAQKEGVATITASAGEATDTCEVVVDGYNPDFLSLEFDNPQMLLYTGEVKPSGATLKYADTVLNVESEKSFESKNTAVVTVDGEGRVTAVGFGTTQITATFTVKGNTVSATMNVSVQNKGSVAISQNGATIYAVANSGATDNTIALSATAYEIGVPVENAQITWSVGEQDVITVSADGVVTALNAGTATVTATYTNAEGNHTDSIEVTVLPLQKTVETPLVVAKNRINNVLTVDLEEITGDNERTLTNVIVSDSEDNTLVTLANGELDFTSVNGGYMTVVLETRNVVYTVPLELFDVAIGTAEEFMLLHQSTDLWYCLDGDIDLSGLDKWADTTLTSVMSGVLDGKGHKITGLKVLSSCGLFKELNGATIKNLTVMDACLGGQSGVFAYRVQGEKNVIENVYVSVKEFGGQYVGGMIGRLFGALKVNNSFVYLPETQSTAVGFVGGYSQNEANITNCVFVGGNQQVMGIRQDAIANKVDPVVDANTVVCTALEAHKTQSSALREFYETYKVNHPYFALNNSNFKEGVIRTLTSEIVELTEDIVNVGNYNLGSQTTTVFSGVFDGNGHTVSGLTITYRGLFYSLNNATVKNVIFKDVVLSHNQAGVIAYQIPKNAVANIHNVYVSVASVAEPASNGRTAGALINRTWGHAEISNTVVVIANAITPSYIGFATGDQGTCDIALTNCVFIGPEGVPYKAAASTAPNVTVDENTGIYTSTEVDDTVLAKMSDQNYKAHTGNARA